MKTQILSRIALAGVALFLLQACATTAPSGPAALTGTWTNSLGTVWTMRADGTFDVDLDKDGQRDAWGTCMVQGDMVTIEGSGTKIPKQCKETAGLYKFARTSNTLHFTLIKDPCDLRSKNVTSDWTKK